MKKLLIGSVCLMSLHSFAGTSLDSIALEGNYTLEKASSEYAERYHCSQEIEILVDERGVKLSGTSDYNSHASFWTHNEGCDNSKGDIGPLRRRCTRFNKNSAFSSDTSYLTIVGFKREVEKIKLAGKEKNKLIYSNNMTQVPFGILGIWDDDTFKCEYKRLI